MSYIAGSTNDIPETSTNGRPGEVYLPHADGGTATAAPTIQQPADPQMPVDQGSVYSCGNVQGYRVVSNYEAATDCLQYHAGVDYSSLVFESWIKENNLEPKSWIATVSSDGSKVVLKL